MTTNSTRFCKTESDIIMVLLKVCFCKGKGLQCLGLIFWGGEIKLLQYVFPWIWASYLILVSICRGAQAALPGERWRVPLTDAAPRPLPPTTRGWTGSTPPPTPYPQLSDRDNSTELGYGQKALGAQWWEGTGASPQSGSWDSPIAQLGGERELVAARAGLLLLHCGEVKHQLKILFFFLSVTVTLEAFITLKFRPFVQT